MGLEVVAFVFGGLLILVSIVGGGFEVRELKIPKVTWVTRVLAGLAGVTFVVMGLGIEPRQVIAAPSPVPLAAAVAPPATVAPPSPVDFTIHDQLGAGQVSEQVTVVIDGRRVGTLTINQHYPASSVTVTVPQPGRYSYTVESAAVFDVEGQLWERPGVGQGMIDVQAGQHFDLAGQISGDTWLVTLIQGETR